jgi:hypothetical protein
MKIFSIVRVFSFFSTLCIFSSFIPNSSGRNVFETGYENKSDTFDIKNESFILPQALPSGKYSSALYLYNIFIPSDWTLDVIKTPMFCYAGRYTLPAGFNLQASLATFIISYRGLIGPFWNYTTGNTHFDIGIQVAYNYATLNQKGYHTQITGWETQPSMAVGYSFKTMAITARGDLYINNSFYVRNGDSVIPYTSGFLNGFSVTESLEQRLSKNHVMSVGLKWNYIRYHIVAWPAFPVNAYHYNVPEVQLGYNF